MTSSVTRTVTASDGADEDLGVLSVLKSNMSLLNTIGAPLSLTASAISPNLWCHYFRRALRRFEPAVQRPESTRRLAEPLAKEPVHRLGKLETGQLGDLLGREVR